MLSVTILIQHDIAALELKNLMPEFVTLTFNWQIITGASTLLLINSSSLSMSVSLIWIDGLHYQS